MRLYIALILAAITMAFATGFFVYSLRGPYAPSPETIVEIDILKREFQKNISPISIINFNSLLFSEGKQELLDPTYTVSQDGNHNIRYSTNKNCFKNFDSLLNISNFEKVWIWEEFRCGKLISLPPYFFERAPFMHPSGKSYAFLAFLSLQETFTSKKWVRRNIDKFHISELNRVAKRVGEFDGVYGLLSKLDEHSLRDIVKGKGTILTKDFILAKLTYPGFISVLEYRFYERKDLDRFLKDSPYIVHEFNPSRNCFYKDGELCWDYNIKHMFQIANTSTLVFFLGLIFISVLLVRLLIVRIQNHRFEDERRRLALRVLSHEFRTPVTSLLLLVERMNKKYEQMDEEFQDSYLRLSSEVFRLQRLVETSRNYLKTVKNNSLINSNIESISSLSDLVYDILIPYKDKHGDDLILDLPESDRPVCLDSYWLQICLKNLVENAFYHGKAPVKVTLMYEKNGFSLSVTDQGKCEFCSLKQITTEFIKGNKSSGTGLGLNIVYKVMRELGGEMDFSLNPTTFKITFKTPSRLKEVVRRKSE